MVRVLRIVSIAVVSLAALAVSDTAWAQPAPGGPGRGMPGGMTLSLSMMYGPLLNSATIQKDLDLLDAQKTKIKEITDKANAARQEMFSGMRGMQDLTPEEARAKWTEMGKKMQAQGEKTTKAIEGVLLPDQLKRLKGIALQVSGTMALGDKYVQKQLKLSDDQLAKMKTMREDAMKKARESRDAGGDRDAVRKKRDAMRKETEKKVMDVLTADQKTLFEKMKGKTLKIPESELRGMMGFGGGRRGGRRGGGGGGGDRPVD